MPQRTSLRSNGLLAALLLIVMVLPVLPAQAGSIVSGPNAQITDTGLGRDDADAPDIDFLGNTVYAAWRDDRANDNDTIWFAKSVDGGTTWGANVQISPLPADDWVDDPSIAVQPDGTIWIVWYRFYTTNSNKTNAVRYAVSRNGGQSFSVGTIIDSNPNAEDRWKPQIAVDASTGRIYVLFRQLGGASYDIFLVGYDPTFTNPKVLRLNSVSGSGRTGDALLDSGPVTRLAASNGVVCAAWEDTRDRFAIYGACSTDGGTTSGPNFAISGPDAASPRIALGPDGALYAGYSDAANQRTITLRRSADRGATWEPPRPVVALGTGDEIFGWDLAVDANGQVVLPWSGGFSSGTGSSTLYLVTSIDNGQNFASTRLNDGQGQYPNTSSQYGATLAVGGSGTNTAAYIAWSDDRNVGDQIWFARAVLDGVPPTAPGNLRATGGDSSVLLNWNAASDATGIQGYRVLRAAAASGPFSAISALPVTATSYRDVGLDSTPYFYAVVAIDGTGNVGPPSNQASAAAVAGGTTLRGTIAYEAGNDLRVRSLPVAANERTLGLGDSPQFSRDGARLFYLENGIQVRPVAGGAPSTIYPDKNVLNFAFAADERTFGAIIFRQFASAGPQVICSVTEPHWGTAGNFTYKDENDLADGVAVSAAGNWLAFRYLGFCNTIATGTVSPSNLCIVNTATKAEKCLEGVGYRDPAFAPSGDTLAFVADFTGQGEVWTAVVQADGSLANYVQLTRGPAGQPAKNPSWSSDGTAIIFQRGADGGPQTLHTVRADGGGVRNLGIAGNNPAWYGGATTSGAELSRQAFLPNTQRR